MQIAYHIGANRTDQDRLLKSVLKNADAFSDHGVKVPGPSKYRRLVRETIQKLEGTQPAPDTREILLDAIIDEGECNRLVMSNSKFICIQTRVFENGEFYRLAEMRLRGLQDLFPEDNLEIFLALRNPATFIPELLKETRNLDINTLLNGFDPMALRWSELVARIQTTLPNARLTVWCNEDTPLIWAQLIRELAGVDAKIQITGGFDLLNSIITPEGMKAFITHLKENPPQTEREKRHIMAMFMERYAIADQIEDEIDLPGWTHETVAQLTANYDYDVNQIEHMAGVNFIAP